MESLSLAYKLLIVGWVLVLIWVPYVIYTNKKIHPKALFVLFFAELWERFSYYGMRALLVLYMIDVGAELSYEKSQAYAIYGAYGAMVYATPLLGGLIAEKFFGYRNSILWGGILMALGHFTMAFPLISELGIGSPESIHALSEPMLISPVCASARYAFQGTRYHSASWFRFSWSFTTMNRTGCRLPPWGANRA